MRVLRAHVWCFVLLTGPTFCCCCSFPSGYSPSFSLFVVSIDQPDATKLETRCVATLLVCHVVEVLRLSTPRSPITTTFLNTLSPLASFSFLNHWPAGVVHYCRTSRFGCCRTFVVNSPWQVWTIILYLDDLVPPSRWVFFSFCFVLCFSARLCFVPFTCQVSHSTISFRHRSCTPVWPILRKMTCKTIATSYTPLSICHIHASKSYWTLQ